MAYVSMVARKKYAKQHYEDNKDAYKKRAKIHTASARAIVRKFLLEYLRSHPCVDCGEADPIVLEFDHNDPSKKRFAIGNAVRFSYSLKIVKDEVAKCSVRCANCHRKKTYLQFGRKHKTITENCDGQPAVTPDDGV